MEMRAARFVITENDIYWGLNFQSIFREIAPGLVYRIVPSVATYIEDPSDLLVKTVRALLAPPVGDYLASPDSWEFSAIESTRMPSWYVESDVEQRCRQALPAWCRRYLLKKDQPIPQLASCLLVACAGEVGVATNSLLLDLLDGGIIHFLGHGATVQEVHEGALIVRAGGGSTIGRLFGKVEVLGRGAVVHEVGPGGQIGEVDGGTVCDAVSAGKIGPAGPISR